MKYDVSIGIPVYNGDDRLEFLLESLVTHHSGVREIIVSDNASTDGTKEICEKYAAKYPNLVYHIRQKSTIPAMKNFYEVIKRANGKYCMTIGHHDLISENYFDIFVPMLENNNSAVAVLPITYGFTGDLNEKTLSFNPCNTKISSSDKRERVYAVLQNPPQLNPINQLHRTEILKKLADEIWIKEYACSDCVHTLGVMLLGECLVSDKAAYYYYKRPAESNQEYQTRTENAAQTKFYPINGFAYIPRLRWEICRKYAAEFADETLYNDIEMATLATQGFAYNNDYWLEHRQIFVGGVNLPKRKVYNAISLALKDEKRRTFYQESHTGSSSPFRHSAEQLAAASYAKMLEILINEKYLFPQYKLNQEETEMLNELTLLKSKAIKI